MNGLGTKQGLLVAAFLGIVVAGCGTKEPPKWTLWYIPNEPKSAATLSSLCHTLVFGRPSDAKNFRVAVVRGVTGNPHIDENHAYARTGDSFTGQLDLGQATVNDDNTGYDLKLDVVYDINSYLMAKTRADADCPPIAERHAVVHLQQEH
jgi:hypothetical protein